MGRDGQLIEEVVQDEPYVPEHLTCSFGSCGHDPETVYWSQGKPYYLCDEHWGRLVSTDIKVEKATRAKLGIPMPEFRADQSPKKWERPLVANTAPSVRHHEFSCGVPDCDEPPTITVRNTRLCDKHWKATRSSDTERRWAVRDALGWSEEDMEKARKESEKRRKKMEPVRATRDKDAEVSATTKKKSRPKKTQPAAEPTVVHDASFDDLASFISSL